MDDDTGAAAEPQILVGAEVPSLGSGSTRGDNDFIALNKQLRACHVCRLIKTERQFLESGCDNCRFLEMEEDGERLQICTTPNFSGMVSVMDPKASWATKWVHLAKYVPGCYALVVNDDMPRRLREMLENLGIRVNHGH
eukprot:jgi/Chrzof1/12452/Cz06g34340.t1